MPCIDSPIPNYTFEQRQDVVWNDIHCGEMGAQTVADVAQTCDRLLGCRAFNSFRRWYDQRVQYCLKSANATMGFSGEMNEPCRGFYIKIAGAVHSCSHIQCWRV
jgi:hypothetical protein